MNVIYLCMYILLLIIHGKSFNITHYSCHSLFILLLPLIQVNCGMLNGLTKNTHVHTILVRCTSVCRHKSYKTDSGLLLRGPLRKNYLYGYLSGVLCDLCLRCGKKSVLSKKGLTPDVEKTTHTLNYIQ